MKCKKVLAALMATLALSGTAATVETIISSDTVVEARARHHKHKRRHVRRHHRRRKLRRRNHRKRRAKKHAVKKHKRSAKKFHKNEWWKDLPKINFDTNGSIFGQIHTALQMQGDKRKAAEYIIMKEEGMVNKNGQPDVSLAIFENQIKRIDENVQETTNYISGH